MEVMPYILQVATLGDDHKWGKQASIIPCARIRKWGANLRTRRKWGLLESTREDLIEISINGPSLPECHDLIEKSMDRAWGGKRWHFNRSYDIREMFKDSEGSTENEKGEFGLTIHGLMIRV